jgi:hypothetical protein
MNIYIALVVVTFLICATILIYRLIDYYVEKEKSNDNYWRGRYYTLWNIFEKAAKCDLSDDMMSDIEEIKLNNK